MAERGRRGALDTVVGCRSIALRREASEEKHVYMSVAWQTACKQDFYCCLRLQETKRNQRRQGYGGYAVFHDETETGADCFVYSIWTGSFVYA